MKLMMLLLSAVMTFTVKSKSAVTADDACPPYMEVSYACTYQKGDVRAGDTATITFSEMRQMTIEQVEVYVRSNKSAGAGTFTVVANGTTAASISGSLKDWTGAYDNVEYHPVQLLSAPIENVDNLSVALVGTTNSLHIEKYVVRYSQASEKTVTLMKGNEVYGKLSEQTTGEGVVLPSMPDEGEWHFAAWSEQHFYETSDVPSSWIVPGKYYPRDNDTLWAVYKYNSSTESAYVSSLEDGLYIYAETYTMKAMSGAVEDDGFMPNAHVNINDISQFYDISFDTDEGTAVIYHPYSDSYIGYQGTKLVNDASPWKVYHNDTTIAFYIENGGKTYILWPSYIKNITEEEYLDCTALVQANDLSVSPTVLISAEKQEEGPFFTCHPETGLDIENTFAPVHSEYVMPFGNYRLIIRNGLKTLQIQ